MNVKDKQELNNKRESNFIGPQQLIIAPKWVEVWVCMRNNVRSATLVDTGANFPKIMGTTIKTPRSKSFN